MGQRLRELRRRAGLTQEALARRIDVSGDTVRKWERGKRTPILDTAARLCDALGCSLDELAGRVPLAKKKKEGK
jgi:transcriptional regulator with XRE-family HTH domain